MNFQTATFTVTQLVGFAITVIFGVEAVVKVGAGAYRSLRKTFRGDE